MKNDSILSSIVSPVAPKPSRKTLEETSVRALKLLSTVGNKPEIARAMKSVGYSIADQDEGWRLLRLAGGSALQFVDDDVPAPGAKAGEILDRWIGVGFRRAEAGLARLHPAQAAFVFDGLKIVHGVEAVVSIQCFLARLDALEHSPAREATRAADHAALETLARRGIGREERARLAELVAASVRFAPAPEPSETRSSEEAEDALVTLHAWVRDWSEMARTVITSRVDLVQMGIGKRRASKPEGEPPANDDAV